MGVHAYATIQSVRELLLMNKAEKTEETGKKQSVLYSAANPVSVSCLPESTFWFGPTSQPLTWSCLVTDDCTKVKDIIKKYFLPEFESSKTG